VTRDAVRKLYTSADPALAAALAALVAAAAFVGNGGLQLGSSTLVEIVTVAVGTALVAAAVLLVGFGTPVHGGVALAAVTSLGGLTALSILWSLHPADSWVETNRTFAYVAAFAGGIAAVRLAGRHWRAATAGVLLGLTVISMWGLASKVAPGWLAADETYARLREPYGYWNAVGVTAAMATPLCLWLGTRPDGSRRVNALAWPAFALFAVTLLLSFSRGSIVAAAAAIAVWLALVPLRLRSLAVLLPAGLAAAAVNAWAFSQSALTDDRIPLPRREDAGVELGLILAVTVAVLYTAGILIQRRAERRPLQERTRRRLGKAAIAVLAAAPVLALGALAASERGIGGTVSDRWNDLTEAEAVTPENSPARLTETASVRSIYWRRAVDVWQDHPVIGAGAGAFAQAQLRYREEQARGKHAHGYPLQTLADLGLLGLAVSLLALGAWALAAVRSLSLRRGMIASGSGWGGERLALFALALVALAFGVHSTLDWTWFVPAVAICGLFCAGWVAGRGPVEATTSSARGDGREAGTPRLPARPLLYRRLALVVPLVALGALAAFAIAQPWRAQEQGDDALRLVAGGDYAAARDAAERAHDINPLSIEPYFELAAIEDARGNERGAISALERAVQVEPSNPDAWRRLGDYLLLSLSEPKRALPVLRGALFLDPLSPGARSSFVIALRATSIERAAASKRRRDRP
jgi:cytochrome c-type biogenesis protein CcmH/NrfG